MKHIKVKKLDVKRFNALAGHSRSPAASYIGKELAWYSNEAETILGILLLDTVDNDYVSVVMGKDEDGQYRAFDLKPSIEMREEAEDWLNGAIRWHTAKGKKIFSQENPTKGIDLFTPVIPMEKQHPYFIWQNTDVSAQAAKEIISHMMPYFVDVDGNFVEQFQSNGFDSRLWELYINSYLREEQLFIDREHNAPDFIVAKYGQKIAIEATTVGRKPENPIKLFDGAFSSKNLEEIQEELADAMPIRFGSSLYSKLQKKYWELPHVKGNPFVIAIADFHADSSMTWSYTALINYLYGVKFDHYYDDNGQLVIVSEKIENHQTGTKKIPSGYFLQPLAENVSAVLFSASGTHSKFNRMGKQSGFGDPSIIMIRQGTCHNHDPNASVPHMFQYQVDEDCNETWGEGLAMYHNPNAVFPVPRELFPSIAHHYFDDGQIFSMLPDFSPFSSTTYVLKQDENA